MLIIQTLGPDSSVQRPSSAGSQQPPCRGPPRAGSTSPPSRRPASRPGCMAIQKKHSISIEAKNGVVRVIQSKHVLDRRCIDEPSLRIYNSMHPEDTSCVQVRYGFEYLFSTTPLPDP